MPSQRIAGIFLAAAFFFGAFIPALVPLPILSDSHLSHRHGVRKENTRGFKIAHDMFWKDGLPFQIIGGDVHYFRVLPTYWEDRLRSAKALGLNAIQTYVPWNLHEPSAQNWVFNGIANIESFLKLTQELGFLVMLRVGPYICAGLTNFNVNIVVTFMELCLPMHFTLDTPLSYPFQNEWDLGGFPAWLLAMEPALKLRSSDPMYLHLVERWWGTLLPKIVPFLYENGGPVIMVQVENEFGSFGDDRPYLRHLAILARRHLGKDIILYTTDGGTKETLEKGSIPEEGVYAAVDFSTGENPWPIFQLQKRYNTPGKSPPLSAEFYTGWLTHWGESNAKTSASFVADYLRKILSCNGSVVLYMAHGGSNFGFFNGANSGKNDSDYKADLTSYDYDAPIKESGDVDNPKFQALRNVIKEYSKVSLPQIPFRNERAKRMVVSVKKIASFFMLLATLWDSMTVVETEQPIPMELAGQMFGFMLYTSQYRGKDSHHTLSIPKVHDRAQVFVSCWPVNGGGIPIYAGTIERWSDIELQIPNINCSRNINLYILVENMGRINYGPYIFDRKGILSSVALDGNVLKGWKLYPIDLDNLSLLKKNPVIQLKDSQSVKVSDRSILNFLPQSISQQPGFYEARYFVDPNEPIRDTFLSFRGWNKGVAFVNSFNIGRYWPFMGPQCTLYVPAPILHHGDNVVVIFELHDPSPSLTMEFVQQPDFTCGKMHQRP